MFDLKNAKDRLGIPSADTTKDAYITASIEASIAVAENYCKRYFMEKLETVEYVWVNAYTIQLLRYPVQSVHTLQVSGNSVPKYEVNKEAGLIIFNGRVSDKNIHIHVDAGYAVLPSDLELALWSIFDGVYAQVSSGGGGASTDGIDSVSITGVGTIRYKASGAAAAMAVKPGAGGAIPMLALNLLDNYKLEVC